MLGHQGPSVCEGLAGRCSFYLNDLIKATDSATNGSFSIFNQCADRVLIKSFEEIVIQFSEDGQGYEVHEYVEDIIL